MLKTRKATFMEFRAPYVAQQQNAEALTYLTKDLSNREAGRLQFERLVQELGNVVDHFPDWHPILTAPREDFQHLSSGLTELKVYRGIDHTRCFVSGFVTCPYSKERADKLVESVNAVRGSMHTDWMVRSIQTMPTRWLFKRQL
jgi:hypothetical protein